MASERVLLARRCQASARHLLARKATSGTELPGICQASSTSRTQNSFEQELAPKPFTLVWLTRRALAPQSTAPDILAPALTCLCVFASVSCVFTFICVFPRERRGVAPTSRKPSRRNGYAVSSLRDPFCPLLNENTAMRLLHADSFHHVL